MKKFIQIAFSILLISIILCGCDNPFLKTEKTENTVSTTTETETTTEGNSQVVTLERTSTTEPRTKEFTYYSDNMGASLTLPASWENKYAIDDGQDKKGNKYISFYEKDIHRIDGKGLIFTFNLFLTKDYAKRTNYTEYGTVTDRDGQVYYMVCTVPTSSQYDEKNKNLKKAYRAISKESYIESICNSISFDRGMIVDKEGCSTTLPTTEASSQNSTIETNTKSGTERAYTNNAGLVFPDISSRKLSENEVRSLDSDKIQQAINDICAIHGYNFTTPSIRAHYEQFSWYRPSSSFSEASFNPTEEYNYKLLQKYR